MSDLPTYDEIRERLRGGPALLLGNGFSIACDPRYSYRALRENVVEDAPPLVPALLDRLATDNFEQVMQILEDARWVGGNLAGGEKGRGQDRHELPDENPGGEPRPWRSAIEQLDAIHAATCVAMVQAISEDHIRSLTEIDKEDDRSAHAAAFLDDFAHVFTTNYDLLLYWVLMKHRDRGKRGNARRWRDGFRRRGQQSFGELDPSVDVNVFFLHGALHLYVHGGHTRKHVGRRKQRLLDIVGFTFDQGGHPLFVAGGRPEQKLEAIRANPYLHLAYDSFRSIRGDLVIFGSSLGSSDQHLLDAMARNPHLERIFFGLYSPPESSVGLAVRATVAHLKDQAREHHGHHPEVELFDSRSAKVWG